VQHDLLHPGTAALIAARNVLLHLLKALGAHGAAAGAVSQAGQEGAQLTGQVPADATRLQDTARQRAVTSAARLCFMGPARCAGSKYACSALSPPGCRALPLTLTRLVMSWQPSRKSHTMMLAALSYSSTEGTWLGASSCARRMPVASVATRSCSGEP